MFFEFCVVLTIICTYIYLKWHFSYWKQRGFPQMSNKYSSLQMFYARIGMSRYLQNIYRDTRDLPYVGIYLFHAPKLVVNDLNLVKKILVQDFENFQNRNEIVDGELDPLIGNSIFFVLDEKWKYARNLMSPSFTPGKIKTMMSDINTSANHLIQYMLKQQHHGGDCLLKYTMDRFTAEAILSIIGGLEMNILDDPQSEMMRHLTKLTEQNLKRGLIMLFMATAPRLQTITRLKYVDDDTENYFRNFKDDAFRRRKEQGIVRDDFAQSIMELIDQQAEAMEEDYLLTQIASLILAGYETSSSTLTFGLYELAMNSDIQRRLRKEIQEILQKHDQQVTYEAIQDMKYLDMVVAETLRKYPILGFLDRMCLRNYQLPDPTGKEATLTLPAGSGIFISVLGIHHDPEYYPDPDKFDPERFTEENKRNRPTYAYLPFGQGPRMCIGMRLGLLEVKAALVHILSHFHVSPCRNTPRTIVYDIKSFLQIPYGDIPVSLQDLKNLDNTCYTQE